MSLKTIKDFYDVVVIGGGISGVSAAIAAKRTGAQVLLIERNAALGGLATIGLIAEYLPLCDGTGNVIQKGIAEELLHLSIKYGGGNLSKEWSMGCNYANSKKRYMTSYSACEFMIALDEIMVELGIDILFDTWFSDVKCCSGVCKGIYLENQSGRFLINGNMFIDATGYASLICKCGAKRRVENNSLTGWVYGVNKDSISKASKTGCEFDALSRMMYGSHAGEVGGNYDPFSVSDTTAFYMDMRQIAKNKMINSDKKSAISFLPMMPQYRRIGSVIGKYCMQKSDCNSYREDSVGCISDWRTRGDVYELSFFSLIAPEVKNVLVAGRCISCIGDSWELIRCIPQCAVSGQAAGTAAALGAKNQLSDICEIDLQNLQIQLKKDGVMIHFHSKQ